MKLERMLSIITYLLNHDKVKAHELAAKFEVNVRTIYRDVNAISQAGIPITTYQGADGGIGIVEGFRLDKSLLTSDEIIKIVTALKGLHSVSEDIRIKLLIEKLTGIASKSDLVTTGNEIMLDLSSWNQNDQLSTKIKLIRKAIQERCEIQFTYYTNENLTQRRVEPYLIVFKETNWYLYSFCMLRKDFRLFKIRRMRDIVLNGITFEKREYSLNEVQWNEEFDAEIHSKIVVLFDASMKYSVDDIFGVENYNICDDGKIQVTFHVPMNGWICGFLLGFGNKVEVLEPIELRDQIKSIAENICKVYGEK